MIPIDLAGKAAVVTGGGRGIGRAVALELARAGADVLVTARTAGQLEETAGLIEDLGRRALILAGDASLPETAEKAVKTAAGNIGGPHLLVNNAGMEIVKSLLDSSPEDFDLIMNVNVKSMMLFTRAAGKYMIENGGGKIVNMASTGGFIAGPNQSLYHASKAACAHFTKAMAIEWARYKINVNAVAPGWVDTELISFITGNEDAFKKYIKGVPMRRVADPREVAFAVAFLCSDLASYMTGSVVVVDGGLMIP